MYLDNINYKCHEQNEKRIKAEEQESRTRLFYSLQICSSPITKRMQIMP